jgi:tetratricopeptide (TPR) repeat protein
MQNQVNIRMLGWLAGSALLLSTGVYFLHAYQVRRNAAAWLRLADRAENEGDFYQAARLLKSYLSYEPGDIEAQVRYGMALERSAPSRKDRMRALTVFEQVVTRSPGRADARRQAATIAFGLRLYADARKHLDVLSGWEPNNGELQLLLGRCAEADGDYGTAQASYRKAISDAPTLLDGYVRLAELLATQAGQHDEARKVLDQMVTASPESLQAHLVHARTLQAAGALEEAAGAIAKAARLAPDDLAVLHSAARLALARGKTQKARLYLQRCLKVAPRNSTFYLDLADLELRQGRLSAALAVLEQGLGVLVNQPELAQAEAEVLIRAGKEEQAQRAIDQLEKGGAATETVLYLKAILLLAKGRDADARDALESLLPLVDDTPPLARQVNLLLAECYQRGGQPEQQLAALRRAVDKDPTSLAAREGLAALLVTQGKLDEAIAEFRQIVIDRRAVPRVWARFAQALALRTLRLPQARRDWREVERTLERADKLATSALEIELVRADIAAMQGDAGRARAVLIDLRTRALPEEDALLRIAQTFVRRGDYAEAGRTCRLLVERRPDDLHALLVSFDVALQLGASQDMDKTLAAIRRVDGEDGAAWHYCQAARRVMRARQGDRTGLEEARDHLARAGARKPAWARVHVLYGQVAELGRKPNAAIDHYLHAIELGESDAATLAHTLELLHERRRDADALPVLDKLLAQGPLARATARVGAIITSALGQNERAVALARQAVGPDLENHRDSLWLASILEKSGQPQEAERVLQDAAERWGTVPDPWIALVGFLTRHEQKTKADQTIGQALDHLDPARADLALAECYDLIGSSREAEEKYKASLNSAADPFLAMRKLAQFYLRSSNPAQAEPLLRNLADPKLRAPSDYVAWAKRELDKAQRK